MSIPELIYEKDGSVAVVRFNRGESRNSLSMNLIKELTAIAEKISDDVSVGAVVLTGGDRFFTAGVDLNDADFHRSVQEPLPVRRKLFSLGNRLCEAWEKIPQVTIASIEGFCIGGGVSLAVSCDFRVMATDAYFRIPEIGLGMNYSWATLPRLTNLVGPANAKKWVILCEEVHSEEALSAGFVQWIVPKGESETYSRKLAASICEKPRAPVLMTKQTVNACVSSVGALAHMDSDQFALTLQSEDFREGVEAFLQKRKPKFNKDLPE